MPLVRGARPGMSDSRNGMPEGGWYTYHGNEPYLGPNNKEQTELTEKQLAEDAKPGPCNDCGYAKGSQNCKVFCGRQRYRRG
jgi:hypothetical protein